MHWAVAMTAKKRVAKVRWLKGPGRRWPGFFVGDTDQRLRQPTQSLLVQMYARIGFGDGALPFKLGSLGGRRG